MYIVRTKTQIYGRCETLSEARELAYGSTTPSHCHIDYDLAARQEYALFQSLQGVLHAVSPDLSIPEHMLTTDDSELLEAQSWDNQANDSNQGAF